MPVPLLDLKRQYASLRQEIEDRVHAVMDSQAFILGPEVEHFEAAVRQFSGAGGAVGMSSGTDAQLAALMALEIGPGDAVLTTPYTFFATAGCISRVGARPVFVDIDEDTFNISSVALSQYLEGVAYRDSKGILRTPTGEHLRAIIPVHLFGLCADMDPILRLEHRGWKANLPVLEDASQAIGAEYPLTRGAEAYPTASGLTTYRGGEMVPAQAGTMGDLGWYSFFPSKNLGAFGDGGLTTCRDPERVPLLKAIRMHGMETQYFHRFVGGNFRLDALQAAVLSIKLAYLPAWSTARRERAATYRALFAGAGLLQKVRVPAEPYANRGLMNHHIYHQYVVRVLDRRPRPTLRAHLVKKGIGCAIYYPAGTGISKSASNPLATGRAIFPLPKQRRANPSRCRSSLN